MWWLLAIPPFVICCYLMWLLVVFLRIYFSPEARERYNAIAKLPGLKQSFLLGNVTQLPRDPKDLIDFLLKLSHDFNGLFGIFIGPEPFVFVAKSCYVGQFLKSSAHLEKATSYSILHNWLGTGLLTSGGEKWRRRRKMLTPAFHFDILDASLAKMIHHCQIAIEKFMDYSKEENKFVDIWEDMGLLALDIISDTAMGVKLNAQNKSPDSLEYVKNREEETHSLLERFINPLLHHDFTFYNFTPQGRRQRRLEKSLHKFTTDVIMKRWSELEENLDEEFDKHRRLSFLDLLLLQKCENNLSFEDIREEVDTFIFEGHDTTSAAMSFVLQMLANYPEVMKKLQDEVDQIFAKVELRPDNISQIRSTLLSMPYLDAVLKEGLRMFPSVPEIGRTATEDFEIEGYKLKKDSEILIFVYAIHHDPDCYKEPYKFNPDRWVNKEVAVDEHPYCYIPFSAGPRNCIGQKFANLEEKLIIASIAKNFNLKSDTKHEDMQIYDQIILRPAKPFHINFTQR